MVKETNADKYSAAELPVFLHTFTTRRERAAVYGCHGFTLVELIVVCAILGVLAMMAIPSMKSYIRTAKNNACASDLRVIDKAVIAYFIEKNVLPASLNDVGLGAQLDPWKRPYVYYVNSGVDPDPLALKDISGVIVLNKDYDIYSVGEDGLSNVAPDATTVDDVTRSNDGSFVGVRP